MACDPAWTMKGIWTVTATDPLTRGGGEGRGRCGDCAIETPGCSEHVLTATKSRQYFRDLVPPDPFTARATTDGPGSFSPVASEDSSWLSKSSWSRLYSGACVPAVVLSPASTACSSRRRRSQGLGQWLWRSARGLHAGQRGSQYLSGLWTLHHRNRCFHEFNLLSKVC